MARKRHVLQIKETYDRFLIGYFDPAMKDAPADHAFRVVSALNKAEVTMEGALAIRCEMVWERPWLYR